MFEGEAQEVLFGLPFRLHVRVDRPGVKVNGVGAGQDVGAIDGREHFRLAGTQAGSYRLRFSLLGLVPVREMVLEVLPELEVVPGGQSIGILLRPSGVLVLGHRPVETPGGHRAQPGRDAGVVPGDLIVGMNGRPVACEQDLLARVNEAADRGVPVRLEVTRDGQLLVLYVDPAYDRITGEFGLGLKVRDGAAGVGTLSFYHHPSRIFTALGHVVTEPDGDRPADTSQGRIVEATVARIRQGRRGHPGEKVGQLRPEPGATLGSIDRNTPFGIVGTLERLPAGHGGGWGPMPLALTHQVQVGRALMLTVLDGQHVESFEVEIVRVDVRQRQPSPKGITIRVTDRRLLERSGGIVQGMSGSPIVQGGRLVGAVTHVFVTDPTRGYAVFAEWMARVARLLGDGRDVSWDDQANEAIACGSTPTPPLSDAVECR
jgi:stage IV sporulation protein B